MVKAYVLISVSAGRALEVATEVRTVPGVTVADAITGEYDVMAIFEAKDISVIGSLILDRIQKIEGVRKTVTCVVITA